MLDKKTIFSKKIMMQKYISKIYDINQFSLLITICPYFLFNLKRILLSSFFDYEILLFLIFTILILDSLFRFFLTKPKIRKHFYPIMISLVILNFYGIYIADFIQNNLNKYIALSWKRGYILVIIQLLFLSIFFIKSNSYKILNTFMIILSVLIFVNTSPIKYSYNKSSSHFNNYIHIRSEIKKTTKPILLLITDEYSSPYELFKITQDSTTFKFSKKLNENNWIVQNYFNSNETSSIHSISSIFNFNLSTDSKYESQPLSFIAKNKLFKCELKDSLEQKNIDVTNFGIFNLGSSMYFSRLYLYPESFLEDLFINTLLFYFKYKIEFCKLNKLHINKYPEEAHNKYIFNNMTDSIKCLKSNKTFIYTHLYMPHAPMQYLPDFKWRHNKIENYIEYWNLTNNKLSVLLNNLTKENKFRIILTGDHGYRNDSRINPHKTFTAFYGFDKADVDQIKSVQDIGSLVNHYF